MPSYEKHDLLLLQLAQACPDGLDEILDSFFGFLSRKTDFFVCQSEGMTHMGFQPGVAEKKLLRVFRRYAQAHPTYRKPPKTPKLSSSKPSDSAPAASNTASASPTPDNKSNSSSSSSSSEKVNSKDNKASRVAPPLVAAPAAPAEPAPKVAQEKIDLSGGKTTGKEVVPGGTITAPGEVADPRTLKNGISLYNGDATNKYRWSQTLKDLTVQVPIPKGTPSRQLDIKISKTHLKVGVKGQPPIIDGEMDMEVIVDECMWNVEDKESVLITLEKPQETFWKTIIKGDPEIDTTKVDSTKNVNDYDAETQSEIRRIMFDQDQKRKGMPTSRENDQQEILRKAWDAPNSPFAGTPYDPSAVNFTSENGSMTGMMPPGMMADKSQLPPEYGGPMPPAVDEAPDP